MMQNYEEHKAAMAGYRHMTGRMAASYLDLFDELIARREEIVAARRGKRDLMAEIANRLPW
jgi:hypothetical protein